jgi:hypothetical protein
MKHNKRATGSRLMARQRGRECPVLVAGCVDSDFVLGQGIPKKEGESSTILIVPPATEATIGNIEILRTCTAITDMDVIGLSSQHLVLRAPFWFQDLENTNFFLGVLCKERKRVSSTFTILNLHLIMEDSDWKPDHFEFLKGHHWRKLSPKKKQNH